MKKFAIGGFVIFYMLLSTCLTVYAGAADNATRHRVGLNGGVYFPTGDFEFGAESLDYDTGGTFGIDYCYMFREKIGIGVFLDYASFSSETKSGYHPTYGTGEASVDWKIVVLGPFVMLEHKVKTVKLYGAAKLGLCWSDMESEYKGRRGSIKTDDDGTALAAIIEAGVRFPVQKNIDLGLAARYSYINQSVDNADDTNLGGLAIVAQVGFNF